MLPEELSAFVENIDNNKFFLNFFNKPHCYLTIKEKWKLMCLLLTLFGAIYDKKNDEIYLHWGVKDKNHFKYIQTIINAILGTNVKGEYNNQNCSWKIIF
ncbi:MAG: hypothetical protein HeimC3_53100 [Candidatus Heimdallarchaeota archaeon LC_3]|nr:MAG: hypothetical protein HeimC3_53100 [Candidatus Heimdallarchaeota archaeon LC_3]